MTTYLIWVTAFIVTIVAVIGSLWLAAFVISVLIHIFGGDQ